MSYHIYTTDGIILKRTPFGEANVLLHIITRDFGLIMASARSARLSASKLRPALQEYAHISVSCIKGRNGWKVTNATEKESFFYDSPEYSHKVLSRVTSVLLQMIQGESPHKEVFEVVVSGFEYLKSLPEKDTADFEILSVLRILRELGYVVSDTDTQVYFADMAEWNQDLLKQVSENKKNIVAIINKALKESHL